MPSTTSVFIVGGGLNGLSTALLLAKRKVACTVVERHPTTSIQYKFRGISPRSMEIYRSSGIDEEIRAHRTGDQKSGALARVKNLADHNVTWMDQPWAETSDISPVSAETCDQDVLEPILRRHAERLGADIRFNTELIEVEQNEDAVVAYIRDRGTGREDVVYASYLVVADGANGNIRPKLGIERHGPGPLQHWINVIFDTDLSPELQGRRITSVFVQDINGTLVPREGSSRWSMAVQYVPEQGEKVEDFTPERCAQLVRKGAGRTDTKAEIMDIRPWEMATYLADRYSTGRAYLVGDTAHVIPPTGGFGGNTGIHDAHNLAWKLDAVMRGVAGPALLGTYELERRPVAERTLAQALARLQAWFKDPGKKLPSPEKIIDDHWVIFGHLYKGGVLIAERSSNMEEPFEDPQKPSGRPGSRAPHVFLDRAGRRISTLDLFDGQWVLLTGAEGSAWISAANKIPAAAEFSLICHRIGPEGDLQDSSRPVERCVRCKRRRRGIGPTRWVHCLEEARGRRQAPRSTP